MTRFTLLRNLFFVSILICSASAAIAQKAEFCWRDSYGRGVGTIPTGCGAKENQAGLCYEKCPAGYKPEGPVCWSACPAGYTDNGAICHINKALTTNVEWVCTAWWPGWLGGGCRWKDSRCPSDYTNVGLFCALTSAGKPPPPGFSGTFLDPMKNTHARGAGTIPTGCAPGQENDAGLCYTKCNTGYSGVGPVCWGSSPPNWVGCGMGSAKNSQTCGLIIFGQVSSVGQMAFSVATAGASGAATSGANASKLADLKAKFSALKTAYDAQKKAQPLLQKAEDAARLAGKVIPLVSGTITAQNIITEEDILRASAQIASIVEPFGVAAAIGAYTYPKCSKYFGPQSVVLAGSTPAPSTTPTPGAPAADTSSSGLSWVANTGTIPANAVIGGQEVGRNLPICHGSYQGGVHPGKVVAGKCNIGWGGKEVELVSFEVLTNKGATLRWVNSTSVSGMVIGGQETGRSLPICRGPYQGGLHPGKLVAGKCNIGWGGKEVTLTNLEVLVQ